MDQVLFQATPATWQTWTCPCAWPDSARAMACVRAQAKTGSEGLAGQAGGVTALRDGAALLFLPEWRAQP